MSQKTQMNTPEAFPYPLTDKMSRLINHQASNCVKRCHAGMPFQYGDVSGRASGASQPAVFIGSSMLSSVGFKYETIGQFLHACGPSGKWVHASDNQRTKMSHDDSPHSNKIHLNKKEPYHGR